MTPNVDIDFFEAILCQQTFWHHLFPKNSALDPIHSTVDKNNPPNTNLKLPCGTGDFFKNYLYPAF